MSFLEIHKKKVIQLLETIAVYMELKGENPFKISAFRKAANALEQDDRSLSDIHDFTSIQGIGKGTSAVIKEFIQTGKSQVLDSLKKEVPEGLIQLLKLPGLGGKKIAKLYHELGVKDLESLKKVCEENQVQQLSGFGKKTEEKILQAIEEIGKRPERLPIAYMVPVVNEIEQFLINCKEIVKFLRAGSYRRVKETVKDLDFIIATHDPVKVREYLMTFPAIEEVIANGDTKVSLQLQLDVQVNVDFRLVEPKAFATTLHHFTGSKEHNVRMRQLAKERGEKISEYGVELIETGEVKTFESEVQFFEYFSLPFIPPELREDGSEVDHYKGGLVHLKDIKGDLHMHSTWSDGAYSIREMANQCRMKGYEYIAITDHSQFLKVANGLTPERLKAQMEEIDKLNKEFDDFTILKGVEMDILPDGTLDYPDELLKQLDFVIASIHSNFQQSREMIMKRLETALKNRYVDMIAHPTGRLIGKRVGYDVDIDRLLKLAKETNTIIELNANPNRLDLCAEYVKKAQDYGVKIAINTDAHSLEMLEHMSFGVSTAIKGWTLGENVINTWDINTLRAFLEKRKHQ